eukprot:TRINITY_DN3553_c0_g1_i10.p1 TRINITY_DN3553_c0_g1~~TRINITY_DN3553_c0_g1_i10.p1  ORF type:complete len:439 (-),score=97.39 TRINITY_DN3553_c0_g1_i10:1858-3039(-)
MHVGSEIIWQAKFSPDGNYLAIAGADHLLRIYAVVGSPADEEFKVSFAEEARKHDGFLKIPTTPLSGKKERPALSPREFERMSAERPLLNPEAVRKFKLHSKPIVDLCWSENNFILTASLDRTVRLWHVSQKECLVCYKHSNVVTGVQFHSTNARQFITGSLDGLIRIWDVVDGRVVMWVHADVPVTSVTISPSGSHVYAGLGNGIVNVYKLDNRRMDLVQRIICQKKKKKQFQKNVVGLEFDANGRHLLISISDSTLYLYDTSSKRISHFYLGHLNEKQVIRGSFSENGKSIVSGSEDKTVHIWPLCPVEKYGILKSLFSFFRSKEKVNVSEAFRVQGHPTVVVRDIPQVALRFAYKWDSDVCTEEVQGLLTAGINGLVQVHIRRAPILDDQ